MLLTMFLFQKWLGSPFPKDVWPRWLLMHWLQLQFTPLPSVWIGFAWQYSQACGHPCRLCTFSYPISSFQSTLHLICFDTALLEQPPLSVMTLCDLPSLWRVSIVVVVEERPPPPHDCKALWVYNNTQKALYKCIIHSFIQWSSSGPLPSQQCSTLLLFQRTRDAHNLYCMDGHLLKLKCKYSNILRHWFLTFVSCKL